MLHLIAALLATSVTRAQVTAAGPNGVTNPSEPSFYPVGSQVNETSFSRLLSLNGIDDFCLFGPPEPGAGSVIGNVEPIVVAYCTKPRNGARIIPDGAITAAHFIKTPLYVQIHGFWDGTKVNIPSGDDGGELDPHGAEGTGNPVGGNVTSNVPTGSDVFYEEWMSFISYDQFCLRICTAESGSITTALQCEHELDIMGCRFVMAIEDFYSSNNSFTSCEGEAAAPPGLYPSGGTTSTFRQRYTGTYSDGAGGVGTFTVGQTITPSAPAFWPATSNCITYSTISNGVNTADYLVTAVPQILASGSTVTATGVGSTSMSSITTPTALPTSSGVSSGSVSSGGALVSSSGSRSSSGASASGSTSASASSSSSGSQRVTSTDIVMGLMFGGVVAGWITVL